MPLNPWMQTAFQPTEAVLLPALERTIASPCRIPNRLPPSNPPIDAFIPVAASKVSASPVRTSGSMAGRCVLRAAGVRSIPACRCRRGTCS